MIQQHQIVTAADRDHDEFSRIEYAIPAMRAGEIVIVVDDEDQENEGQHRSSAYYARPWNQRFGGLASIYTSISGPLKNSG